MGQRGGFELEGRDIGVDVRWVGRRGGCEIEGGVEWEAVGQRAG